MKKWFKAAVPSFLWRLDDFLLINHPLLWASRLHFFLYFQSLLTMFGLLLASFQTVNFLHVPEPFWILIYGIAANLIMLILWVYFQTLMHICRFHGFTRFGFSLKVSLIFILCAVGVFISAAVPYFHLTGRIHNAFSEPQLPDLHTLSSVGYDDYTTVDSIATIDTVAYYPDSTKSADAIKYGKLYSVQTLFDSLPGAEKENITVILEGKELSYFKNLELNNKAEDPYLMYEYVNYKDRYPDYHVDILKVFYAAPLRHDSIWSEKFGRKIWKKEFVGQVNDQTDTVVRYYFNSKVAGRNLIGTADNVLGMLLEDKTMEAVNKAYARLPEYERSQIANRLYNSYSDAKTLSETSSRTVVSLLHFAVMLAIIILLLHAITHLFGIRSLFLGLILPVLLYGLLIGFKYLGSTLMVNSTVFYSLVGVLILFGVVVGVINLPIAPNTLLRLIGLQLLIYLTWLTLLILPYYWNTFQRDLTAYLLISMILAVGLSALLLRYLYRLYTQPVF